MPVTIVNKSNTKSRGLIIGSPNTGKTRLLSLIKNESVIVLSFPDEKGVKSIPNSENVNAITFEYSPLPENSSVDVLYQRSLLKYTETLNATRKILKEEYGKADILFLDGLSKFYDIIIDIIGKGNYLNGKVFDDMGTYTTRIFGPSREKLKQYLSEIYESAFRLIITTSWERLVEPDENASSKEKADHTRAGQRVWLPALPGQMANLSTGEFDWCIRTGYTAPVNCTACIEFNRLKEQSKIPKSIHATYQLQPYNDCLCVGVKGRSNVPVFIHQDWDLLKGFIL